MGHTYGTWLPGDPRGFRTQQHREHVEGDYKKPPPAGRYEGLYKYSKSIMRREPVFLKPKQRQLCARFLAESLLRRRLDVVVVSVDSNHFHILARFLDSRADHWIGVAKRETSHYVKLEGKCPPGGLWARNGKAQPITDREHQLSTVRYILKHRKFGAAVWFQGKLLAPL